MIDTCYATLDASGRLTGFYPSDIWPTPPAGAVAITLDVWREALANPGGTFADGVYAPPSTAPTQAQLLAYIGSKVSALEAIVRVYQLSAGPPAVSVKCDATDSTRSSGAGLAAWGLANPTASFGWQDNFGVVTQITGAEVVTLFNAVVAYGMSVYAVSGPACTAVLSGTITTTAQIDALAWPA